jgi:hypothetical protein
MNINKEVMKIEGVTSSRYDFDNYELKVGVRSNADKFCIRIMINDLIGNSGLWQSFKTITLMETD